MGKTTITFNLSVGSVQHAITQLREYKRNTQEFCDKLAQKLVEKGVLLVRLKIGQYDVIDTGLLISSVTRPEQVRPGVWRTTLFCDNGEGKNYALYCEFGTGIEGEKKPHPLAEQAGWQYDVNQHGNAGWWYPTDEADKNPTKKVGSTGEPSEYIAHTKGQPARPFWYETLQELPKFIEEAATEAAREVFGNAGL